MGGVYQDWACADQASLADVVEQVDTRARGLSDVARVNKYAPMKMFGAPYGCLARSRIK